MSNEALQFLSEQASEVYEFRATLTPETDRGCALMAAAYLDDQLRELLSKCFIDDSKAIGEYFSNSGPLGTFSSRIESAYLLGAISSSVRRDLHLIRKIRNDFGHNPKPIGFDDEAISNRCKELHLSFRLPDSRPRSHFTASVFGALAMIHSALQLRTQPKPNEGLVFDEDLKEKVRDKVEKVAAILEQIFEAENES
jgi:DNA-binding MltR family transcriptional regulator